MTAACNPSKECFVMPSAAAFAEWPSGWHVAAMSRQIDRRPLAVDLFGRRIVCYRRLDGVPVAMDARCWHMGADLSQGAVIDDAIQCPFHGWRFGPDGRCAAIPSQSSIPACAAQKSLTTAENAGRLFVFSPDSAAYPLPFFSGTDCRELVWAAPFELHVKCPWWLVGTNGFDVQHFAGAHDRRLTGSPVVSSPHPAARRIVATFEVCPKRWRDRLTRRFAGSHVTMDVTMWSGTLAFVIATFQNGEGQSVPATASYGMTEIMPRAGFAESLVRVTIFVRRRGPLSGINARLRRSFVRAFLQPDVRVLDGAQYHPDRLIAADAVLADYLCWLAAIPRGSPFSKEPHATFSLPCDPCADAGLRPGGGVG